MENLSRAVINWKNIKGDTKMTKSSNPNNLANEATSTSPTQNNKPLKQTEGSTKPVKATDRMAPQFTGYAEGRKPNAGGNDGKR
ncbi:MAG: hypothetical protein JWM96_1115 [Alphaproteobacteria bacterium]|nr:hypothetical protein [Alphaproteobacteria bacterium]